VLTGNRDDAEEGHRNQTGDKDRPHSGGGSGLGERQEEEADRNA
jgi:hypothetical protein